MSISFSISSTPASDVLRHLCRNTLPLLLFLLFPLTLTAQAEQLATRLHLDSTRTSRLLRADSLLGARYRRLSYDTLYLARPAYDFTAKARINVSGNSINTSGTFLGKKYDTQLNSDNNITTSIGISYRGIGFALSLNPAKLSGRNHSSEFNVSIYNNRWGVDAAYQDARDYHGSTTIDGQKLEVPSDIVTTRLVSLNAYFVFNRRRFSFPAAFTQSYIQLRSAGSWMLALSAVGGVVNTHAEATLGTEELKMRLCDIGIGGGYGYNWAVNRHLMFHISALPTVVVAAFNSLTENGQSQHVPFSFPEFILTGRTAATYYFNDRHFASLTYVITTSIFPNRQDLSLSYDRWRLRLCYGFRFSLFRP